MKKTLAILLAVLFLMTVTVGAVSAITPIQMPKKPQTVQSEMKINSPLEAYKYLPQTNSLVTPMIDWKKKK